MAKLSKWEQSAEALRGVLPKPLCTRRCELLPQVLEEWERSALGEHLSREPRADFRKRIKKRDTVTKLARHLHESLDNLEQEDRQALGPNPGPVKSNNRVWLCRSERDPSLAAPFSRGRPGKRRPCCGGLTIDNLPPSGETSASRPVTMKRADEQERKINWAAVRTLTSGVLSYLGVSERSNRQGSNPIAAATSKNSKTSSRRSPPSYFATKDGGLPSRSATTV
jgi:hypothetical protein